MKGMARCGAALAAALAVALVLGCVREARCDDEWGTEYVKSLSGEDEFMKAIGDTQVAGVMFFAPWCGHCKNAKPAWYAAGELLVKDDDVDAKLFLVDMTNEDNKPIGEKHGVRGFPTIKYFTVDKKSGKGKTFAHEGGRTEEDFLKTAKAYAGPASTLADADWEVPPGDGVTVLGFYDSVEEGTKDFDRFVTLAESKRGDAEFFHTTDPAVAKKLSSAMKPGSVAINRGSDGKTLIWDADNGKTLGAFYAANAMAPFIDFTKDWSKFQQILLGSGKKTVFLVGQAMSDFEPWASELAPKYPKGLAPAIVFDKATEMRSSQLEKYFGITGEGDYAVALEGGVKYVKKITGEKDCTAWVEDLVSGKAEPYVKSQEPFAYDKSKEAIMDVVATDFTEKVSKSDKNVMVMIHASWCGHCKKMMPEYEKLAEELKDIDEIVISRIDGAENDVPDPKFPAGGFPSVFFKDSKGQIVKFDGDRDLPSLKEFVMEKSILSEGAKAKAKVEL